MAYVLSERKAMPMGLNSTQFIRLHEIKTGKIDLYEDAYGIYQQFPEVITLLEMAIPLPGKKTTEKMKAGIRKCI